jgi:DNA-binding CsgD family transcriptional regulator
VLRRISAGKRVPTVAKELYISQSTVRNHLAAIFERFGVHSQADLLARLADGNAPPG